MHQEQLHSLNIFHYLVTCSGISQLLGNAVLNCFCNSVKMQQHAIEPLHVQEDHAIPRKNVDKKLVQRYLRSELSYMRQHIGW